MRKSLALFACVTILTTTSAFGWNGSGHMLVAYIAYQKLESTKVRPRVDALLKLHPNYAAWTQGVAASQKGLVAFLNAATWPDCIKQASHCPGYHADGTNGGETPPNTPEASQNIGFADKDMHKYWHYVDEPFSAGAPGHAAQKPNVETEINLLTAALAAGTADPIKSYDVTWLIHLVGDIHQPLHATSRFTKKHPAGDNGGNLVHFSASQELHAYWDDLLGPTAPPVSTITTQGKTLVNLGKPAGADVSDVAKWKSESLALAESDAYMAPISPETDPSQQFSPAPDAAYHTKALADAKLRVRLAGYRLANLLNSNLK